MRFRPGGGSLTSATEATAATAFVTEVATATAAIAIAEAATVSITIAKSAATAIAIAKSTTTTTTTATAAWLRRGRGTVELKLSCHRLAAILRELEREVLAFGQRVDSSFRQCGDVHEHICSAAVR